MKHIIFYGSGMEISDFDFTEVKLHFDTKHWRDVIFLFIDLLQIDFIVALCIC